MLTETAERSMNIRLIGGAHFPFGSKRYLRQRLPVAQLRPLAPRLLAAITPPQHRVEISDFAEIAPDRSADLVGMSFTTPLAKTAYILADQLRRLGVTTVAGGVHASLLPDDAQPHFDSIVVGPAETTWPRLLRDLQDGNLQRRYRGDQPASFPFIPPRRSRLSRLDLDAVEITRGCTNFCGDFCAVPYYYGSGRYFIRPIEEVITQMKALGPFLFLYDNNLVANLAYANALFTRMAPLGKRWIGAATLKTFVENPWLAKVLRDSGCLLLFIGLESLVEENLRGRVKAVRDFETGIKILHDNGIGVEGSFIVGLAHDTPATLEAIPEFTLRTKIEYVSLNIATPYPGTGFFKRMERQGRLLTTDWSLYDAEHVVFRPDNMTPGELQESYEWLVREVFSLGAIVRRSFGGVINSLAVGGISLLTRLSFEMGKARDLLVDSRSIISI